MTHGEKLPRIDAKLSNAQKVREWKLNNPEKHHAQERRWRQRHQDYFAEWRKKRPDYEASRYQKRKEYVNRYSKAYRQTAAWDRSMQRSRTKRRSLEPIETHLNQWFKGSHLHHMGQGYGIYLPQDLHLSIRHSLTANRGMDEINWTALTWLVAQ